MVLRATFIEPWVSEFCVLLQPLWSVFGASLEPLWSLFVSFCRASSPLGRLLRPKGAAEERNREAAEMEYLRNELHQEEAEALHKRVAELKVRKQLEDFV